MLSLRTTVIVVGLMVTVLFAVQTLAQITKNLITASLNRSGSSYHKTGYQGVFNRSVLLNVGGVLSQANQLNDQSGKPIRVAIELMPSDTYSGSFVVRQAGTQGNYTIEYTDLVPMALFVDSGGTSLYTLWEDDLFPSFRRDAGFVKHSGDGYVALEFAGTRYADALYCADICQGCLGSPDANLASKIMENISKINLDMERDEIGRGSQINTDLALSFLINVRESRAIIEGGIVRLYWKFVGSSNVEIKKAVPLVPPDGLSQQTLKDEVQEEDCEISPQRLKDAFFLFETLALLRTAKETEPKYWSRFMQTLKSEKLVSVGPEPWMRYTRSYCSVYPEAPECAG